MIKDIQAREAAIDPTQSFIVQAPAGSGKTEILTQRFLRLLGGVEAPEQIVALTFTRKAASEMRERILKAIEQASLNQMPESAHQKKTYQYARDALTRDKAMGWNLLNQPSRLRISTIDSLCQRLVQAIPIQENGNAYAAICETPLQLYREAAFNSLNFLIQTSEYNDALSALLRHFDNQQERILDLFCDLLGSRDQWLSLVHEAQAQKKETFEKAIGLIEQHEMQRLYHSLPNELKFEVTHLIRQFANFPQAPEYVQNAFRAIEKFDEIPAENMESLAKILLTKAGVPRKQLDQHAGFKSTICPKPLYQEIKQKSASIFENLTEQTDFIEALNRVKNLPKPQYDPDQWQVLQSLFIILPILAAHLHILFKERNEVDFSFIAQTASNALGQDESPTDLALYLDYQIHHLLVDEFQDTSILQFHLLEKLTHGWQPDEGKTLFVVGDPMQSIYRFRAAEVGLFLRAQEQGIGPVLLSPLHLSCNFRSTETIIDWVNLRFSNIFPKRNDIESGAVTFHKSDPIQPSHSNSHIQAKTFENKKLEAQAIIQLLQHELNAYPHDDIAILVRSRNELKAIMTQLRHHQIPFQGLDIDPLSNLPHLMDVWSLTQALLMPSNRLTWLAFLRSPWCGIHLQDLHVLANIDRKKSILPALLLADQQSALSDSGKKRCRYIGQVLSHALATRYQYGLSEWVMHTLATLNSEQVLSEHDRLDLEQFYQLLDRFDQNGQITAFRAFEMEFNKLYSQQATPSKLQIMTIHKSKGLEFDSVILPGLSAKSPKGNKPLLRWLKLPTEKNDLLLVSPVKAVHQSECLLYDYLEMLDQEKSHYESQRLLYVAATRAKQRLHLFDHRETGTHGTFRSFLTSVNFEETLDEISQDNSPESSSTLPPLYQLRDEYYDHLPKFSSPENSDLSLSLPFNPARLIGICTHEILQWIGNHKPSDPNEIPWHLAHDLLFSHGIPNPLIESALGQIKQHIFTMLEDPNGQWILGSHDEEQNEYELLVQYEEGIKTRIIDRVFIDNGKHWIIDYKTGDEQPHAMNSHKKQVNEYARLMAQTSNKPIYCGLYYVTSTHWVEWAYKIES